MFVHNNKLNTNLHFFDKTHEQILLGSTSPVITTEHPGSHVPMHPMFKNQTTLYKCVRKIAIIHTPTYHYHTGATFKDLIVCSTETKKKKRSFAT